MKDLHKRWQHRWVTPKAKATKSAIDKLGVIAIKNISKEESVAVLGGVIVPKNELEEYHKSMGDVGIQVNDDFFIVPTTRNELEETGVFNHSCEPNIGLIDSITFVAIKNIKKGEELVLDYAFCESFCQAFKCGCGSPQCRKIVTPNDWKIPQLQKKYRKYFSPYLKEKF